MLSHPRYWPTWIGLGLLRVLSWLPLPLIYVVGAGLGMLLYSLHAPRRHVVRINIERCFPSLSLRKRRRMVRRHFRAFGQSLVDITIAWWAGTPRLKRLVRLRHRRHLDEALRAKRNVILLVPHFLGIEIGGIRLSLEAPVVSVIRHPDNKLLRILMQRARTRFGAKVIEHNQSLTTLVRAVKSGSLLHYSPDQDAGYRHSVFAPFFGIPAATFTSLGRLARLTDALVIPCITYQRPWGRGYDMVFHPPLSDFPTGDPMADATRMNEEIERSVRLHPEQYFWLHKRFKTRPPGEPKFY